MILKTVKEDEIALEKNTNNDKVNALREEIDNIFELNGMSTYAYYIDHDEDYVYFEVYNYGYKYYKINYTYENNEVSVPFGEAIEVKKIRTTEFRDIVVTTEDVEKSLLSKFEKMLNTAVGKKQLPLIKALDNELMIAIEPLYSVSGTTDLHGDSPTLEANTSLVDNFNKALEDGYMQAGLFHKHKTDSFHFVKAWLQEEDVMMGDTLVKAGTPLVEIQFTNKKAWELKKTGDLMPPSIGAKGSVEDVT
jgi:hypothetical protein